MSALRYVVVVSLLPLASIRGADSVWIEAESLANPPAGFKTGGWGNKHYLSGESWLFAAIDGKDADAIPAEGITLRFPFSATKAGNHEVWARVGYEFVRSPFRWRIDGGEWATLAPDVLTTDLMDVAEWTEIAWVQLGSAKLDAGKHTLEIHFPRRERADKKGTERILAGLDCFCLSPTPFRPNGPHKPDADWKTDLDRAAEKNIIAIPAPSAPRQVTDLAGAWQIARWDEQEIKDRDQPVAALPADYKEFFWKGVAVPGNRDKARPDFLYCHRFLYRTQFQLPEGKAGSVVLRFPSTALLASVFVNGTFCGGNDTPCAAWDVDVTKAVKPGAKNELVVAIKDCYYALEQAGDGRSIRTMFNYPANWFYEKGGVGATRYADFPVLYDVHGAGIFETPLLILAKGPVTVADVFVRPSVAKKTLGLEVTLRNSGAKAAKVALRNAVFPDRMPNPEKTFAKKVVEVPASGEVTVELAETWEDPKLWWPDAPQLYDLRTEVVAGDEGLDLTSTKFGFREWTWEGQAFKLNGIPWRFRADLLHNGKLDGKDPKKVANDWKKAGINTVRYWGYEPWVGDTQKDTLDFYDRIGMPVRRSGIFDGQVAPYLLVEQKDGKTVARKKLFDNWIKQCKAWVKAERNHPSIFVWSLENEVTYINTRNLGWLDPVEPEIRRAVQEVMKLDPTRPAMIDGGDALRDRSLPIYGDHYFETNFRAYPDEAYTLDWALHRRQALDKWAYPWPIGDDRPLFLGETFFAAGFPPAAFAAVQGEAAFLGRAAAEPGVRLFARMLAEGYRWHGLAGFHFWMAGDSPDNDHYKAFQPVCALVREWDSTFASGQKVKRTIKVFNDTRSEEPIEFVWAIKYSDYMGRVQFAKSDRKTLKIRPGEAKEFEIEFKVPDLETARYFSLVLNCSRDEGNVFQDTKEYRGIQSDWTQPKGETIHILDPNGIVAKFLKVKGIAATEVKSFETIPDDVKVLVVGPDALTPRQATDPKWQALAAKGARILVLDQENPLHYQAVPADLEVTPHIGRIAFPEDLDHPAFAGSLETPTKFRLHASDFFCRSGDHVVYRHAYKKATRGARSLLQCDDELSCTALAECPVGSGVLMLCQAVAGSKLETDPVCQKLFRNLLNYCASYKPVAKATVAVFPDGDLRLKLLDAAGLKYTRTANLVEALKDPKAEIVVADASPRDLARLTVDPDVLRDFTARGGQLMLWGLTEKGLKDFNTLVGVNHALRPFKMERVTLPAQRDPLLAGITARDVALEGTEKIYPWAGDRYPAADTFTEIVDLDDIAPFGKSERTAHGWAQMTNGLTSADSWKFIFYHNLKEQGAKPKWEAEFPKEVTVTRFAVVINAHYHKITKLRLVFDGNEKDAVTLDLKPEGELRQEFAITPPRKCRRIALEPLAWTPDAKSPVIGIDNLWITVPRDDDYRKKVVPLLNLGGLVRYKMGAGGVVLNQLRVPASEPNPVNAEKKQTIVATLLRNLGATFAAERTLVAGANLKYSPAPLGDRCNAFLTAEKGWPLMKTDLAHFPVGEQRFAGVTYDVRDFRTSPLPACVMLAGPGTKADLPKSVTGIPVGKKADALFFLHTFLRAKEWQPRGEEKTPPVVFAYVVHYADGSSVEVPVRYERGVGNFLSSQPAGVAEASVAWAAPFPNDPEKKDPPRQAVVYQMMWKNPRPGDAIQSVDLKYDEKAGNQYGAPVLLGITAGMAE
jgi:hypothetical protein